MPHSHRLASPRHVALGAIGLLAAVALLLVASSLQPQGVSAATVSFEVEMLGANEVPAASSAGSGHAEFTFNDETRELTYSVTMIGLDPALVTASHIHRAPAGTAGPPIHTLASGPFENISGTITLSEADVTDLEAGNLYVNIHSTLDPSGFARGQLALPAQEPGAPSTGTGFASPSDGGWQSAHLAAGLAICASLALLAMATVAARAPRRS